MTINLIQSKPLHLWSLKMYRHNEQQLEVEDSFGGYLCSNNRWGKLTKLIPWEDVEKLYSS